MEYQYRKISHEGNKTIGIRTYRNNEADRAKEDSYPTKFEILQEEEPVPGLLQYNPAKLKNGYYPIAYFSKLYSAAQHTADGGH
jgi:hypothetical protein